MSNKKVVILEGVLKVTQVLNKWCTMFESSRERNQVLIKEKLFEGSKEEVSGEVLWCSPSGAFKPFGSIGSLFGLNLARDYV